MYTRVFALLVICAFVPFQAFALPGPESTIPVESSEEGSPVPYGVAIEKFSGPVREAITASQGQVIMVAATWAGPEILVGNGVLIDERHVLTMMQLLPPYPEAAQGKRTVYAFNGIPARLIFGNIFSGFAVLEFDSPVSTMKPVVVGGKLEPNMTYEGLALLDITVGTALPIRLAATSENEGTIAPAKPPRNALGTPLWDANGKLVAIVEVYAPGEKPGVITAGVIQEFIGRFQRFMAGSRERLDDQKIIDEQTEVFKEIMTYYAAKSLNKPQDLRACAAEMLRMKPNEKSCRDKWSVWLPPVVSEEAGIEMSGKFGGVGMEMGEKDGKAVVIAPFEGGPAYKAGIQAGDEILEVGEGDNPPVKIQDTADAVKRIRGQVGTKVTIVIGRGGVRLKFGVVRQEVVIHAVEAKTLDNNIGYLRVKIFSQVALEEFREEMKKFRDKDITKVILDFRNNPGGLLSEALELLYQFARPDDILMVMKERTKEIVYNIERTRREFRIRHPAGEFRDFQIVVLINKWSASGSEVFAGTMKDWGYTIIGSRSFGKGVGQTVVPLSDGSGLHLTTFEFLVGNSKTKVNEIGVEPHHVISDPVPGSSADILRKDKQYEKAIEILSK